jgi:hypothetical protein
MAACRIQVQLVPPAPMCVFAPRVEPDSDDDRTGSKSKANGTGTPRRRDDYTAVRRLA